MDHTDKDMYRSMYFCLNSILADVLELLEREDYARAGEVIRLVQCEAEDILDLLG